MKSIKLYQISLQKSNFNANRHAKKTIRRAIYRKIRYFLDI